MLGLGLAIFDELVAQDGNFKFINFPENFSFVATRRNEMQRKIPYCYFDRNAA